MILNRKVANARRDEREHILISEPTRPTVRILSPELSSNESFEKCVKQFMSNNHAQTLARLWFPDLEARKIRKQSKNTPPKPPKSPSDMR